jgi:cold shock CspA family protein/ribosome-associated translation inhibitor RaiA
MLVPSYATQIETGPKGRDLTENKMAIPIGITYKNFSPTPAVDENVRQKSSVLERYHDRIVECRVVLEQVSRHHRQGRLYEVRVDVIVPGGEIVASRSPGEDHAHEDLNVAIRDAFKAARRRLEDHLRRSDSHRATVHHVADHQGAAPSQALGKTHHVIHHGTVVRLFADEEYGFIATPDDREVYFHRNSVVGGGWDNLDVGSRVRFTEETGEKGPHAHSVALLT